MDKNSSSEVPNKSDKKPKRIRLLLSSPVKPFGAKYGDGFSCQTNGSHQLTWAQDIFRVEDQMWHWGLDLIAKNINVPTTVLHYPSLKQFIKEIKNNYAYIGLSFNLSTFHKIKAMVNAVRKFAPDSKIILGGYGTILPDKELEGLADYICREEGLKFMHKLLQEEEKAFVSPNFMINRYIFSLLKVGRTGIIFLSVGCPNGCDFCCTSHYYKRKKIYFYRTPKELFEAIMSLKKSNKSITSIIIFDDDFLVDEKRAREFLNIVKDSKQHLDIMVFASVRSISQFSAREIAEMGITKVWIGFEGREAGYEKQKGKEFKILVEELRYFGISVTASMMIGFDYQTKNTIRDEFNELSSYYPTATQIILVTPCVGTPLWEKLNSEGRLIKKINGDYKLHDGFNLLFEHPCISSKDIEKLQKELYNDEYQLLGPSAFRILYTQFQGYKNLRWDKSPILRERAAVLLKILKRTRIFFEIGIKFAPNNGVRGELRKQYSEITNEIGSLNIIMRLTKYILLPFVWWTKMRFRYNLFTQPKYLKRIYNHR